MELFSFLLIAVMGAGAGGDSRQPYIIEFKDASRPPLYGFWDERRKQSGGIVRVELDTPWDPVKRWENLQESSVAATQERPSATEKRYKDGFGAAGYVTLPNGMLVSAAQYELAERARKMAGLAAGDGEGEPEAAETSAPNPDETEAAVQNDSSPAPSFFEQWGAHIGLLLVAVLLTGLVVRMTFLS